MALFHQIKCSRCDRQYSSIHRRCPYCGARRRKGGRRDVYDDRNDQWQLIFGGIILLAIVIAIVALILTYDSGVPNTPDTDTSLSSSTGASPSPDAQSPSPDVSPSASPSTTITSITLNKSDLTISDLSQPVPMSATISPAGVTAELTWYSNDENVCTVSSMGVVIGVNRGTTTIYAMADGVRSNECIVRVAADASPSTSTDPDPDTSAPSTGNLSLSHTDVTIHASNQESFTLTVSGNSGTPSYSVGNSAVATVSSSGTVTAVGTGTTTVTVTVDGQTLECIVRVV